MISYEAAVYRDEVTPMLKRLRRDMPAIDRVIRQALAMQIVGHIQANFLRGQALKRKSGDLANHVTWRHKDNDETMVGVYGVIYARIHELGGEIRPVRKPYLCFKLDDGQWVRTKLVRMPRRPYLLPGILTYFESGQGARTGEAILRREFAARYA